MHPAESPPIDLQQIAEAARDCGVHEWSPIPELPASQARIRITVVYIVAALALLGAMIVIPTHSKWDPRFDIPAPSENHTAMHDLASVMQTPGTYHLVLRELTVNDLVLITAAQAAGSNVGITAESGPQGVPFFQVLPGSIKEEGVLANATNWLPLHSR